MTEEEKEFEIVKLNDEIADLHKRYREYKFLMEGTKRKLIFTERKLAALQKTP